VTPLWALCVLPASAHAQYPLRSPQVYFASAELQNDLGALGETINVSTDQIVMGSSVAGNMSCPFLVEIVSRDTAAALTVGVYSTSEATPALCPLLSGGFRKGWYCDCHVIRDTMVVGTFDEQGAFQGFTRYAGFDGIHVGLYVQSGGDTWCSEDARNQGRPQLLSFAGTGACFGFFFDAFEKAQYDIGSTFTSVVLDLEAACGDPVRTATWGQVKTLYR
jgi:hypothetical protein